MTTITIPRSITAAQSRLTELGELATATEWHRAAIVATYVPQLESARAFARRGIVGLTTHETVLIYARAWLDRFDQPKPGGKVTLPTDPWPTTALEDHRYNSVDDREAIIRAAEADGTGASKAVDIAKNKAALAAAIKGSPAVAAAAAQAVAEAHPDIAAQAIVDNEEADIAVSRTRTERLTARPGVREMRDRTAERDERMGAAIDESTTELERTGLAEHQGNLHLRQAVMHLALAAVEFDRNPIRTAEQEDRFQTAMFQVSRYIGLLRGEGAWTSADDDFLSELGIEGVAP
jgi:hypothetical protein